MLSVGMRNQPGAVQFGSFISYQPKGKILAEELTQKLTKQGLKNIKSHASPAGPVIFFYAPTPKDVEALKDALLSAGAQEVKNQLKYKNYSLSMIHKPADEPA